MSEELRKQVNDVLNLDAMVDGTQIDIAVIYSLDCRLDVSVRKICDGHYSFGYDARTKSITNELECGINTFKGDVKVLFLGFVKSLLRVEAANRYSVTRQRINEIISHLSEVVPPVPEDESKVNLEKWQIPITFNKSYLR